jgi:hypothetical protein
MCCLSFVHGACSSGSRTKISEDLIKQKIEKATEIALKKIKKIDFRRKDRKDQGKVFIEFDKILRQKKQEEDEFDRKLIETTQKIKKLIGCLQDLQAQGRLSALWKRKYRDIINKKERMQTTFISKRSL